MECLVVLCLPRVSLGGIYVRVYTVAMMKGKSFEPFISDFIVLISWRME